jgi:hypothetical protein
MDAGVHLPLIDFGGGGFSHRRLAGTVNAARECGFAAVSVNDHFLFPVPWLDGLTALTALTALAAVAGRSGALRTGPTAEGESEEKTARKRVSPPSTGST